MALARLIGRGPALRYLYDGSLLSSDAAASLGLVDDVVDPGSLDEFVQNYALSLAEKPASGLAAIRQSVTTSTWSSFEDALAVEKQQAVALANTDTFRQRVRDFLSARTDSG